MPPGRGKLATKPLPTGSPTVAKMMGMVRVCCSSAAVAGVLCERMTSGCSATSSLRESLRRLRVDKIAELTPQLVTFNGNSFDLPVLRYRAMIHGISAPGLAARPYFNRYTEDTVDLCDILSSFAPHTKASLNELSKIMGMPGKPEGMDGNEVERYFLRG
jgi:hypothetical protein